MSQPDAAEGGHRKFPSTDRGRPWQVRPRGVVAEAALQILIPYGNIERPDKLLKLYIVGRLDGHQNLSE